MCWLQQYALNIHNAKFDCNENEGNFHSPFFTNLTLFPLAALVYSSYSVFVSIFVLDVVETSKQVVSIMLSWSFRNRWALKMPQKWFA